MKLKNLCDFLESYAPLAYQEDYDNSGLIVGNPEMELTKGLVCLDCTEAVVNEAIETGANIIIAHHPIVFSGIKQFQGKTYVERVVMKAIQHQIAIYAIHTNLDNVKLGVNKTIADKLGLVNSEILLPKEGTLRKLQCYCPNEQVGVLRDALFAAGAGNIGNYSECSFVSTGEGTFKPGHKSKAYIGEKGIRHYEPETCIEVIFPQHLQADIIKNMMDHHPYEEVAYQVFQIDNPNQAIGAGMIGNWEASGDLNAFLALCKKQFNTGVIKHTADLGKTIHKVAICGGSGSFLTKNAIKQGADVLLTSDFKYHQFFDAEAKIVLIDIGHYESEQFTMDLLLEIIQNKFPTFALSLTKINTNPVFYY